MSLFGLLIAAVTILGTAFSSSAQTTYFATWGSPTFPNGTTSASLINQLAVISNWAAFSTTDPAFSGTPNLAAIEVDVDPGENVPDINATSKQNFYTALKNYYVANGNIFPTSSSFNITAVVNSISQTYTVRVQLKN